MASDTTPHVTVNSPIRGAFAKRAPVGLLVASWTCWVYGLVQAFGAMVILTLALRTPQADADRVLTGTVWLLVATAYCVAGYGLRKGTRAGRRSAVLISGFFSVLQVTSHSTVALLALPVNLLIISLVLLNWSTPSGSHEVGPVAEGGDR